MKATVRSIKIGVVAIMLVGGNLAFGDKTWTGSVDRDFENGSNWSEGSPPADDTTTDVAIFTGAAPANQPQLTVSRKVKALRFTSSISGDAWHIFNESVPYELELGSYGIVDESPYNRICRIGTNAILKVTGPTDVKFKGNLYIYSKITGSGGLVFDGLQDNNYQGWVYLYGDNDFTGDVVFNDTVANKGSYVSVRHNNALGAKPGLVVRVVDQPGYQASGAARLELANPATTFATNVAEIIIEGEVTYPAYFYQGKGTTISNTTKITLEGGIYTMSGTGSGDRYNYGEIHLKAGTISSFYKSDGHSVNNSWYQRGQITGQGALKIYGSNANDETLRLEGDNTYSGGTIVQKYSNQNELYVKHNNAFGSGPVVLDCDTDTKSAFALAANLTMPNAFRGRGKVTTGSYVLTTTGSIAPRDTGLSTVTKNIGTIYFEDLKFGSDSQGATYIWQYNETSSDLIQCDTLTFGSATNTLSVEWLGSGKAAEGTYVLFSWTGGSTPPTPNFNVIGPSGMEGKVEVDGANKQVKVTLKIPKGTLLMVQ